MAIRDTEEIKSRLSILDVVSPYVKLKKAGKSYKGLSPFNKEKTPSFFVSPERGTYYCFSTNQGGDIFTFVEKMEGVDFQGALKILAEKAGVTLSKYESGSKDKRDKIYETMALAEKFFIDKYNQNSAAQKYVTERGINEETAKLWGMGFAPDEWRSLISYAGDYKTSNTDLINAGLAKEAEGKKGTFYDKFRNRIMFPIRDIAGRTIAFSGRSLEQSSEVAKYMNSPETDIFKKDSVLYGMDVAKSAIRSMGYALIVEGQMDLIMAHQAGFKNAIALSGTAFSDVQLSTISRFANNIMLALDSDRAGIASMEKNATMALKAGMSVKVVAMPEGEDPADVISKNRKDFAGMVADAKHVIDFFVSYLRAEHKSDRRAFLLAVGERVGALIKSLKSPIEKEHFIERVATALEVSKQAFAETIASSGEQAQKLQSDSRVETKTEKQAEGDIHSLEFLKAFIDVFEDSKSAEKVIELCRELAIGLPQSAPEKIIFEVHRSYPEEPSTAEAESMAKSIILKYAKNKIKEAAHKIRESENIQDKEKISEYTEKHNKFSNIISKLSN